MDLEGTYLNSISQGISASHLQISEEKGLPMFGTRRFRSDLDSPVTSLPALVLPHISVDPLRKEEHHALRPPKPRCSQPSARRMAALALASNHNQDSSARNTSPTRLADDDSATATSLRVLELNEKDLEGKGEELEERKVGEEVAQEVTYPEGGWVAWGNVLGSFLVMLATFGFSNS